VTQNEWAIIVGEAFKEEVAAAALAFKQRTTDFLRSAASHS